MRKVKITIIVVIFLAVVSGGILFYVEKNKEDKENQELREYAHSLLVSMRKVEIIFKVEKPEDKKIQYNKRPGWGSDTGEYLFESREYLKYSDYYVLQDFAVSDFYQCLDNLALKFLKGDIKKETRDVLKERYLLLIERWKILQKK
jgi:hypothetical protein